MSRFNITDLPLSELKLIERQPLGDSRGLFTRLFCQTELAQFGWSMPIAQINHTYTAKKGTVRGLHYQTPPYAEVKLVSCIQGTIWDVVVDLRSNSPTFLQWYAIELSAENNLTLLIPEGFAHGFQTLSNNVEMLYCHSAAHTPEAEAGINSLESRLGINWPVPITEISEKDRNFHHILDDFAGVKI